MDTATLPFVSRETFHAAVVDGELATIEAFFQQSHVLDEVGSLNAYIRETRPTNPVTFTTADGSLPWFRRPESNSYSANDLPLVVATCNGHEHVLQWFFSAEQAAFMSETLAFLLPVIANVDSTRPWNWTKWTSHPRVLDTLFSSAVLVTLFSSAVFCESLDGETRQAVLDKVARECRRPSMADVAVAHGAHVRDRTWVREDASAYAARTLRQAAHAADHAKVKRLLAKGFVDADARDATGRTPLMLVAKVNPTTDLSPHFADKTAWIARALLLYGDVNLVDDEGRTALHFVAQRNFDVARILLSRGADPRVRDVHGYAPLDYLDDYVVKRDRELILLLVQRGADPFAVRPPSSDEEDRHSHRPRCMYDRLMKRDSGRAFVRDHAQEFDRSRWERRRRLETMTNEGKEDTAVDAI